MTMYRVLLLPGHGVDGGGEGLPLVVEEVEHDGVQDHAHQPNLQHNQINVSIYVDVKWGRQRKILSNIAKVRCQLYSLALTAAWTSHMKAILCLVSVLAAVLLVRL